MMKHCSFTFKNRISMVKRGACVRGTQASSASAAPFVRLNIGGTFKDSDVIDLEEYVTTNVSNVAYSYQVVGTDYGELAAGLVGSVLTLGGHFDGRVKVVAYDASDESVKAEAMISVQCKDEARPVYAVSNVVVNGGNSVDADSTSVVVAFDGSTTAMYASGRVGSVVTTHETRTVTFAKNETHEDVTRKSWFKWNGATVNWQVIQSAVRYVELSLASSYADGSVIDLAAVTSGNVSDVVYSVEAMETEYGVFDYTLSGSTLTLKGHFDGTMKVTAMSASDESVKSEATTSVVCSDEVDPVYSVSGISVNGGNSVGADATEAELTFTGTTQRKYASGRMLTPTSENVTATIEFDANESSSIVTRSGVYSWNGVSVEWSVEQSAVRYVELSLASSYADGSVIDLSAVTSGNVNDVVYDVEATETEYGMFDYTLNGSTLTLKGHFDGTMKVTAMSASDESVKSEATASVVCSDEVDSVYSVSNVVVNGGNSVDADATEAELTFTGTTQRKYASGRMLNPTSESVTATVEFDANKSSSVVTRSGVYSWNGASVEWSVEQEASVPSTPLWMTEAAEKYGVAVENLEEANENYTFVEFAENPNNKYNIIDTGVALNDDHEVTVSANLITVPNGNYMGSLDSGTNLIRIGQSGGLLYYQRGNTSGLTAANNDSFHTFFSNKDVMRIDSQEKATPAALSQSGNFYLFAINDTRVTSLKPCFNIKIAYCTIKDTTGYIRVMIPAINADGVIGMLDIVNNVWYQQITAVNSFSVEGAAVMTLEEKLASM